MILEYYLSLGLLIENNRKVDLAGLRLKYIGNNLKKSTIIDMNTHSSAAKAKNLRRGRE